MEVFDYSNITPSVFERIARCYLKSQYPDFEWEITPSSGDGNKDIQCKYKVLNQEFEYWAEAKFTRDASSHTLSKGQLDPTLVSALLYPKPVSLCFISNNQMTESYLYRLKDFKLKTNIGIELILKDEFENWLINNPEILAKYNIRIVLNQEFVSDNALKILSATITDIYNYRQYKIENYLVQNEIYYLYIIIIGTTEQTVQLRINDDFAFPSRSNLLDNPKAFNIKPGKHVYKFEVIPLQLGNTEIKLDLASKEHIITSFTLPNITITHDTNIALSYIQQEKTLLEILEIIQREGTHNFLIPIIGNGSTGKTRLLRSLYEELDTNTNVQIYSFVGNEYIDSKTLIQIILFLNIGNIFDYEEEALISQVDTIADNKQKIYYRELLEGYFNSPEKCIKFLKIKSADRGFSLIYPAYSRVRQIIIIDDIHKISDQLIYILRKFILQFLKYENNQTIILATRGHYNNYIFDSKLFYKDWVKVYLLEGLSKSDKLNTINHYFQFEGDISFSRATDDLIIFSNILQNNLQNKLQNITEKRDLISESIEIAHSFENPQIVNTFQYREQLNQLSDYHDIIECVYYINFGIKYTELVSFFSYKKIDYLIERKVLKRIGKNIFPYHDYYVKAYFEDHTISNKTVSIIKKMCDVSKQKDTQYLYISLLVRSGFNVYCQVEKKAHELEYYYFKITDYYKAYVLAKAFKQYIEFDEQLSLQEIYDLFILAVTSGYFVSPYEVRELYDNVIKCSRSLAQNPDIRGIIFRSQSEIVNINYWELELDNLEQNVADILKSFPQITNESPNDMICAYLNMLNRKMVIQLLFEKYDEAERIFQENITAIQRLDRIEYLGYLYMDYAKGFYNCDLNKALDYMLQAQSIFAKISTEHRRLLDCNCEVEYLKCLKNKESDISELEYAAEALNNSHFVELYSKAKLKLAAIKMVRGDYSETEIKQDIYLSKYVLDYSFTGRLALLYKMVENAFYIYSEQANNIKRLSINEEKAVYIMGNDYQKIWRHNKVGVKRKVNFLFEAYSACTYLIDPRIW